MRNRHVEAGALDQRITVQAALTTEDALGQPVKTWATYKTVWAQAYPIRGREYFEAGGNNAEANVRFRLNWRSDITTEMRVLWRGVEHGIVDTIDVDGARRTLELMCSSGPKAS